MAERKGNKGEWQKGDLDVVKLVINGKVVKDNTKEKKEKPKKK